MHRNRIVISCFIALPFIVIHVPINAGVTTDGSLGPAKNLSGPHFAITSDLGRRSGPNLFHSFQRFNLRPNQSATFSGPGDVRNILARVTGGERSIIRGQIRSTIPGANLFLMNPAGVVFKEGASLDLAGSFVVTTADVIHLGFTGTFPASLQESAVLATASPTAYGFLSAAPSQISIRNVTLVTEGESLATLAGPIVVRKAGLRAPAGRIALASTGTPTVIDFDVERGASRLSNDGASGSISITGESTLTVDDDGSSAAGRIELDADRVILKNAVVTAQTLGPGNGLGIAVRADDELTMNAAFLAAGTFGPGEAGSISVRAGRLLIAGNRFGAPAGIVNQTTTGSDGGTISVVADALRLRRSGQINSVTSGIGDAGRVSVNSDRLSLTDGGFIGSTTLAEGRGAEVNISADRLTIAGRGSPGTGIFSDASETATGAGGSVSIFTRSLRVADFAAISTTTDGAGPGGDISIRAERILLDDLDTGEFTGIAANTQSTSPTAGRGGTISIDTGTLTILDGAGIAARSRGPGRPGAVDINATGPIVFDGRRTGRLPGITTRTSSVPTDGGDISIRTASDLQLFAAEITATTSRDDGNISIDAAGDVLLSDGSRINARAARTGGVIAVRSDNTILRDDSRIIGTAGGLDVLVSIESDALLLDFTSAILTDRPAFEDDSAVAQGVSRLPVTLADPNLRLSDLCARVIEEASSFTATGRGAAPPKPGDLAATVQLVLP